MHIKLKKRPKSPIIVEGFPGFGMVGAISAEFLIQHLKTELIGKILFEDTPAITAIHEGRLVEPFGVFYNKRYNLIILHALTALPGHEWELSDAVIELAKQLKSKEIISLEGVGSVSEQSNQAFYYTTNHAKQKIFKKLGVKRLDEGIILGITAALLVKADKVPVSCIFAEAHTNLPDSKAAAKVIQVLDKYLGLGIDYKPLLVMAEKFEEKIRNILQQGQRAQEQRDKKAMSYVG
jgi:predicted ATP-grasp superfamily ATP-dependent carboligase